MGEVVSDQADATCPCTGSTATSATSGDRGAGQTRRRRVTVGGVVGVLAWRGGRWVLANDLEVRVLEALRGSGDARGRLLALVATLDAGMIDGSQLRRLSCVLGEIGRGTPCLVRVPGELLGAVAYACASWDSPFGGQWLRWALSAQLDAGLVRMGLAGPGWESRHWQGCLDDDGFGRETHWISEMPERFWELLGSHDRGGLGDIAAACDPATLPKVLWELSERPRWRNELLDLVASHPRAPKALLAKVGNDAFAGEGLHFRVAQNLNTTPRTLDDLGYSRDERVRTAVALNPNTAPRTLKRLAGDRSVDVRVATARSEGLAAGVLAVLASDREQVVRSWAAVNASTPPHALKRLLGDRTALVRACAAANPNTPVGAVATRAGDRAIGVRCAVAARIGIDHTTLQMLAGDPKPAVRTAAAANRGCGETLLGRLAADSDRQVRAAVAGNDTAPVGVLELLAADSDWWPRTAVASNPATDPGVLAVLACDSDEIVRAEVAANPNTPAGVLEVLAGDACDAVRCFVARNPALAERLLRSLAADESERVRVAAAENPSLRSEVWAVLAGDDSYFVRAAVAAYAPPCRRQKRSAA